MTPRKSPVAPPNLRTTLIRAARTLGVEIDAYERAFLCAQIASAIHNDPRLGDRIAFKGGTVARLAEESPRLSRDLDGIDVLAQGISTQDMGEVLRDRDALPFIATANNEEAIPAPLMDRLRFIRLPAYTAAQQLAIGRSHLLPKLMRDLGIEGEVNVEDSALSSLVHDHPHTEGCRQLEQRLQVVLSRALRVHLEFGVSVAVDADLARTWIEPERGRTLGFRPIQPSGRVEFRCPSDGSSG